MSTPSWKKGRLASVLEPLDLLLRVVVRYREVPLVALEKALARTPRVKGRHPIAQKVLSRIDADLPLKFHPAAIRASVVQIKPLSATIFLREMEDNPHPLLIIIKGSLGFRCAQGFRRQAWLPPCPLRVRKAVVL
jgi:hypothetical protein